MKGATQNVAPEMAMPRAAVEPTRGEHHVQETS